MRKRLAILSLPFVGLLVACGGASSDSGSYGVDDVTTTIYGDASLVEHNYENDGTYDNYRFSYSGSSIEIKDGVVTGRVSNTDTKVEVTNPLGEKATFNVHVESRPYQSLHASAEKSEGWFDDVKAAPVGTLTSAFANGVDISSSAYLYEKGARFYNEGGVEQSLYSLLKDSGVNWVRIRLWVDPTNHNYLSVGHPVPYGGGYCDYQHALWMAKEATKAGLKYLLDFHYSDFYADPGHQIIPKSWAGYTTASAMGQAIYDYTKETLTKLKSEGCEPAAVQIGNELTSGLLRQLPGTDKKGLTGGNPAYSDGCSDAPSAVSGAIGTTNFHDYLSRGLQAVKDVDQSILTMVHFAIDLSSVSSLYPSLDSLSDLPYDIIGLSAYCYWHWSSLGVLSSALSSLSSRYVTKKICLAEMAYGFTYEKADGLSAIFSETSSSAKKVSAYDVSAKGQAAMIRDATAAVSSLSNGFGAFYWEPAWSVVSGVGWGDSLSSNSWANQGLFSYEGKALGSLKVYKEMLGK